MDNKQAGGPGKISSGFAAKSGPLGSSSDAIGTTPTMKGSGKQPGFGSAAFGSSQKGAFGVSGSSSGFGGGSAGPSKSPMKGSIDRMQPGGLGGNPVLAPGLQAMPKGGGFPNTGKMSTEGSKGSAGSGFPKQISSPGAQKSFGTVIGSGSFKTPPPNRNSENISNVGNEQFDQAGAGLSSLASSSGLKGSGESNFPPKSASGPKSFGKAENANGSGFFFKDNSGGPTYTR